MVGVVIVAHCNLADEFLQTVKLISGEVENFCSVRFNPDDSPEDSLKKITEAVKKVNSRDGVLILTDMFGGNPSNLSLSLLVEGKVEVLTGVNLPMLVKLVQARKKQVRLRELAQELKACGQKNICLASDFLKQQEG